MEQMKLEGKFGHEVGPMPVWDGAHFRFRPRGIFMASCFNQDGSLAWREVFPNGNTTAGLNNILGVYFNSVTQSTTWYGSLVDNSGWSAFAAGDTIASHSGWTESTAYSETVRQTWSSLSVSGAAITGGTMTFTMNATATIKGAFLVSESTKGGTSGTLWATGAFSGTQAVVSGQTVKVTYSLTAS